MKSATLLSFATTFLFAHLASAQIPLYGQCGGMGWTGGTQCASGATCIKINDWYSQCQPGSTTPQPPVSSSSSAPPQTTTPTQPPPQSGPITVLPLGDSITFGIGSNDGNSYRKALKDRLTQDGITIDYIGTVKAGNMQDNDCQGHSGATIDQISGYANTALAQRPQVVLIHAGTNDISQDRDLNNAPNRLMSVVDKVFTNSPNAVVLVATIIPISYAQPKANTYNSAIQGLLNSRISSGRKIVIVSMAGVPLSDMPDGVHPNANGYVKMGTAWYNGWKEAQQKGWL